MTGGAHRSGRELNDAFHREVIAPLLGDRPYAATLLGWGSDVLGYDTDRSTDHGWGPRLQIFVAAAEVDDVRRTVDAGLPESFGGWPVRYGWDNAEVDHRIGVSTLTAWLRGELGLDPRDAMDPVDWLLVPQQRLLGVVGGAVYADDGHEVARVRDLVRWYPHEVWLWLLACQWRRVAQEEAFVGRAAEVGDGLGSRLLAARLATEVMRLTFLLERRYWPYTKWFGTAFSRLAGAAEIAPILDRVLDAGEQSEREGALAAAYETVARRHNAADVTAPVDPSTRSYHDRPFRVLMADRFVEACLAEVSDPTLRALPLAGSVDQFADSTDVLSAPGVVARLRGLYRPV